MKSYEDIVDVVLIGAFTFLTVISFAYGLSYSSSVYSCVGHTADGRKVAYNTSYSYIHDKTITVSRDGVSKDGATETYTFVSVSCKEKDE